MKIYIIRFVLLMLAYFLGGKLGHIFTLTSYPASALWPASGIALAGLLVWGVRFWPAVFLGAVFINYNGTTLFDLQAIIIAVVISIGVTFQAVFARFICIKMIPHLISKSGDVLETTKVILWGGVLACLISATIGTITLYLFDIVVKGDVFLNWFVWWAGDLMGVIVFTPMFIFLLSQQNKDEKIKSSKLWLSVLFIVVVSLFISLFLLVKRYHIEEKHSEYKESVRFIVNELQIDLYQYSELLLSIDQFFIASENVSAKQFTLFVEGFKKIGINIGGLFWAPKVLDSNKDQFIKKMKQQGYDNFTIFSPLEPHLRQEVTKSDAYFPVSYVAPYDIYSQVQGFDIFRRNQRNRVQVDELIAFMEAEDKPVASPRVKSSITEDKFGSVIFHPVIIDSTASNKKLLGYVIGVLSFQDILKKMQLKLTDLENNFLFYDVTSDDSVFLYDSRNPLSQVVSQESVNHKGFQYSRIFDFAERRFEIRVLDDKKNREYNGFLWNVIAAGSLFIGMVIIFVLSLINRSHIINVLVNERTKELREVNEELEAFSYRTSHDLRSPLVSSIGLLNYIKEDIPKDNITLHKNIGIVQDSLKKLEMLVLDILDVTKTNKLTSDNVKVDIHQLINKTIDKFSYMEGFSDITFVTEFFYKDNLLTQEDKITIIVENLISNAIKYRDKTKDKSYVHIKTSVDSGDFILEVVDNGIGIPKKRHGMIFGMFSRFHPKVSFGSGLGLYMVKKAVNSCGGKIEFEDIHDGTLFRFTLFA